MERSSAIDRRPRQVLSVAYSRALGDSHPDITGWSRGIAALSAAVASRLSMRSSNSRITEPHDARALWLIMITMAADWLGLSARPATTLRPGGAGAPSTASSHGWPLAPIAAGLLRSWLRSKARRGACSARLWVCRAVYPTLRALGTAYPSGSWLRIGGGRTLALLDRGVRRDRLLSPSRARVEY
jgi:hypothetical protein